MSDAIIRKYSSMEHSWSTKGHKSGRCTECTEPAVVSVDWQIGSAWTASYCDAHLKKALEKAEKREGRKLELDDRRLGAG